MSVLEIVGDQAARERAIDNMLKFLKSLHETFPECPLCRKAEEKFRVMVVREPELEHLAIEQWLVAMATPLPAAIAKYVHPLERLLGAPPIVYHAVAYDDGDALIEFGNIPLIQHLDLGTKWHHPEFAENRVGMLRYIDHITRCAVAYAHVPNLGPLPHVPSCGEIEAEIARFAAEMAPPSTRARGAPIGVGTAFQSTLESIAGMLRSHTDDAVSPTALPLAQLQEEWDLLMANDRFVALCKAHDPGALRMLEASGIEAFGHAGDTYHLMGDDARTELWTLLNNLISFSTVASAMPVGMRTRVEEVAAQLSAQMEAGTLSLDQFTPERMMEIGQSVLAGTTPEDLESIVAQMDRLLPAVREMTRNNEYLQGINQQSGGILGSLI